MRLWHQKLIPYLDRQRLLSQHREACALRGRGWGRPHSTVNYVFTHDPSWLVAYHWLVMDEMKRRGYNPDGSWGAAGYRGSTLGMDYNFADEDFACDQYCYATHKGGIIYPEHNDAYLRECIELLKIKEAPINFEEVEKQLL